MTDLPLCCGRAARNSKVASLRTYADVESLRIDPVRDAVEGARSFAQQKGFKDPHEGIDYHRVMTHDKLIHDLGRSYDKLPEFDPKATPHFDAMRHEVGQQFHHLTHNMGIQVHVTDHDPYKDVHELAHDVRNNHRIQVMGTHMTGAHPYFSNHENDQFRAVHDVFGHLATGRGFDRHGEEAAFQAHSRMFSGHALPAMASETRGQNGSLISNGHFGPQRIAILPKHLWHPGLAHGASREDVRPRMESTVSDRIAVLVSDTQLRYTAHVSGNQIDVLHCPFCGSGAVIGRSDGTIECGFCTSVFTVQTQPQFNGMPQSIDGQPYQWPGTPEAPGVAAPDMPDGTNINPNTNGENDLDPEMDPTAAGDMGDAPQSSDPADGGDADEEDDEGKPAFLKGKGDSKSDKKDDKKKGDNPFAKKKSYLTSDGAKLDEADFLAHLAITFANDPRKVASLVKKARWDQ